MLYLVMEKGDTDLSTFFKSMKNSGDLTPYLLSLYWEKMLSAVQVLHKEGEAKSTKFYAHVQSCSTLSAFTYHCIGVSLQVSLTPT